MYVTYITTTAEKLWEALTQGEFTEKYWGGRRVESTWSRGRRSCTATTRAARPTSPARCCAASRRRCSYTFGVDHGAATEPASRVTFELKPLGPMVRLTLTHDQFIPDSKVLAGVSRGWPGILSNLKTFLETGKPMPFGIGTRRPRPEPARRIAHARRGGVRCSNAGRQRPLGITVRVAEPLLVRMRSS
ncbi:SRPBCC family protein [Nannocystis pusilla]|uniref:SRPBCC family protein n=1 Tax=Nannocystis pusilla TaxID=889268 RepID=A0A9X3EJR5_9BACT|nr:SRPBCC family protein [Nannocystis pusilla]